MKIFKKTAAVLLAAIMSIGTFSLANAGVDDLPVQTVDKTWNMGDHEPMQQASAEPFDWNGLHIEATSLDSKTAKFDGTYLIVQGGANVISFKVGGSCKISVTYKSNKSTTDEKEARGLTIKAGSTTLLDGTLIENKSLGNNKPITAQYTGSGDTITLTPMGGGVSISEIKLTFDMKLNAKGDINGDKNVNKVDADMVLRHLSGLDELTDEVMLNAADVNSNGEINIADVVWILNHKVGEDVVVDSVDTSDGTEVSNESDFFKKFDAKETNKKIYVMDDISFSKQIKFDASKDYYENISIIGVPDSNGNLPVLNFEGLTGVDDKGAGIKISSSNNTLKNLIIEKANDNGIQIKEVTAKNNVVENCIVRYNNDSGIQISKGAEGTILKNVYSYRNCDLASFGGNADGFAIKLGAGPTKTTDEKIIDESKTTCIDCYAWENGDDGWDSFDKQETYWTYRVDYNNCMCWNNGIVENALGYTDYVNGKPLDENMTFIRAFKKGNPSAYNTFVTQYNNGSLCSRTVSAEQYYSRLDSLLGSSILIGSDSLDASGIVKKWGGNPNGFKFGSAYTQDNSERYVKNCIAFDHVKKGFDQNNSGAKIWAENCVAFNNKQSNYALGPYTAYQWNNIYGWSGSNDLPTAASGVNVSTPKDMSQNETAIRNAADRIISYAQNNTVVPSSIFTEIFGNN